MTQDFSAPASEVLLQQIADRIRERNVEVLIVNDGEEARQAVLERLPKGAQVYSGKSKTLQDSGIFDAIQDLNQYNALRHQLLKMDRKTQAQEIRKLLAAPDFMLGSVQAITVDGILVDVSATGSQIGPYANTAGKVILVVGSQKIVPDLDAAFKRIREYVQPWEEAQVRKTANMGTFVGKILIIEREWINERVTVILVREPIGI
ncbi:MAG: LUD domain-containing protein [Anaerolineales bacterium]